MNVFEFTKIEKCYICGNIDRNIDRFINLITNNVTNYKKETHPKEIERQERLKKRLSSSVRGQSIFSRSVEPQVKMYPKKMKSAPSLDMSYNDSVIIVSGNCGIGSKSMEYYHEKFEKLNKILSDNNTFVLFVRGNNDNPSIFNNREIDFEHVKTLPDYSVVQLKTFNCLCIGGSVSIDKEWKMSQENTFGKKLFWEGEAPFYDEDTLDEILKKFQIDCVVTSTSPSFSYPGTNAFKRSKWFNGDKTVLDNFTSERKILDKIYEKINDSETKPYFWFYGRFKMGHNDKINDIVFNSLVSFQIVQVNSMFVTYFGISTSNKLSTNNHAFDAIFDDESKAKKQSEYFAPHPIEPIIEGGVEDNEFIEDDELEVEADNNAAPFGGDAAQFRFEMPQYTNNYYVPIGATVVGGR